MHIIIREKLCLNRHWSPHIRYLCLEKLWFDFDNFWTCYASLRSTFYFDILIYWLSTKDVRCHAHCLRITLIPRKPLSAVLKLYAFAIPISLGCQGTRIPSCIKIFQFLLKLSSRRTDEQTNGRTELHEIQLILITYIYTSICI